MPYLPSVKRVHPIVRAVAESIGVSEQQMQSEMGLLGRFKPKKMPKGRVAPDMEQVTAIIDGMGRGAMRDAAHEIVDILARYHPDFHELILKQVDVEWNLRSWAACQAEFPPGSEPWVNRDAGGSNPASGSPPASAQTSAHPSSAAPASHTPDLP